MRGGPGFCAGLPESLGCCSESAEAWERGGGERRLTEDGGYERMGFERMGKVKLGNKKNCYDGMGFEKVMGG